MTTIRLGLGALLCALAFSFAVPRAEAGDEFVLPPASGGYPLFESRYFLGSAVCVSCHDGLKDENGSDVSIVTDWSSSMMANASRDPYWRAKVKRELAQTPALEAIINDKCTRCHAPLANTEITKTSQTVEVFDDGILDPDNQHHNEALDGVSCTLCHQIQETADFGTPAGMSGQFAIGSGKLIYGPFENPLASQMVDMIGFTPVYGPHISDSKLCASCHDLKTPFADAEGNILSTTPESEFPEQMSYSEWEHSNYNDRISCQQCHMSRAKGTILAHYRDNFAIHDLIGANVLMLDIFNDNKVQLGVLSNNFEETLAKTEAMLKSAASLELPRKPATGKALDFTLRIASNTGHKLPTNYPSRRVVLHVAVEDASHRVVWESGKVNANGSVKGVDSDTRPDRFEPHYDLITAPGQVQVYESVMGNDRDEVTYALLRGAKYLKDNRILPTGFDKQTASGDVMVVGAARKDRNFVGGGDSIRYRIGGLPDGKYTVRAELVYQSLSYAHALDLFADTTTPEVVDFKTMFDASDRKSTVIAELRFAGQVRHKN